MHSTNVRQIKAALVDQAFHDTTQVNCPLGRVVAVSRWKGQLRVMIRGWPRWYPVESVCIEGVGVAVLGSPCVLAQVGRHHPSLVSPFEGSAGVALHGA
jgi:hypothetical protein